MDHIICIKKNILNTKIKLVDDNDKKRSVKISNIYIKNEERHLGMERGVAKIHNVLKLYGKSASEEEINKMSNMFNYKMISTRDVLALERAAYTGKIKADSLKEYFERIVGITKTTEGKNRERLQVPTVQLDNNGGISDRGENNQPIREYPNTER